MKQNIINMIFIICLSFSMFISSTIVDAAKEQVNITFVNKKQIPIEVKRKAYTNIKITKTNYSVLRVNYTKSPHGGDFSTKSNIN